MLQPKLVKIEPVEPNKLRLFYETGEVKLFDVAPYIKGYWYEELKDPSYKPYGTAKTGQGRCNGLFLLCNGQTAPFYFQSLFGLDSANPAARLRG